MAEMQDLTRRARDILRRNDRGGYTVPTAGLYPYQWNWDSCLVALGWASFDEGRAWQEIDTLFAAQWADGMVPHIVFHASDPGYFPGPDVWATGREPASSGITQPPVAASIVRRLLERAEASEAAESAARRLLPKLAASHRWWHSARDPGGGGLVATLHPWESGMDNSPAWDEALARVPVGELPPYQRRDTGHVDAAQRPTRDEYDRYLSLVLLFRELGYDPGRLYDASPYRVADVGSNAILLRADRDLAWLADTLGDRPLHDEAEGWVARGEQGFQRLWDEEAGLFLALDLTTERQIATATSAGFLGLYAGAADPAQAARLVAQFDRWRGDAAYGLPSVAVDDPLFDAGRYWRGPSWAIANHLIARGLDDYGHTARAAWLAADTARAIHHGGFHEYFHPLTGEGLGGDAFTWTAAMWLAWLDPDPAAETAIAMRDRLAGLYPAEQAAGAAAGLSALAASHRDRPVDHPDRPRTIPQDAVLIAYGHQVSDDAGPPLDALRRWVEERLDGVLGSIHLLPIYPYSSDDGFSVIDYRSVDPALGDWNDVARLAGRFSLMLDAVINHVSAQSDWFAAFCEGRAPYREFFLSYQPEDAPDISGVTRPRTSPLLSRFETADGPRLVWTTFSDDQIDVDPANPDV
ncbi:MAG: hypothetical protein HKM95_00805, partial [Inquilinus sp.]|nr:hypothetical protein [Inquilinus sp.]